MEYENTAKLIGRSNYMLIRQTADFEGKKIYARGFASKKIFSYALTVVLIVTTIFSINITPAYAYVTALGNVLSASVNGDTLNITVDNGTESGDDILELKVLENNTLRVNYRPNGVAKSAETPMIDPDKTWNAVGATINTATNPMTIETSSMRIEVAKTPCRMTVKKADGTTLLWEPAGGGVFYDGVKLLHQTGQNIYGIRGYDFSEETGDILRNDTTHAAHAGQQGDCGGPVFWSTSGYGVLVDSDGGYPVTESSTGRLEFYYGGTPTEGRRYTKSDVEYFVMVGNPKEIMGSIADITGKTPMMPKWSLGFMNFEWGTNQTEMANMVDTYRAKNIPIDAYALDYDWKRYGDTNYGEFTWNTTKFPDSSSTAFKTLMDGKGIKMIGITKPRIVTIDGNGNRTSQYTDANNGGYWYPGHNEYQDYFIPDGYSSKPYVRSIDPYNANERTWYWNNSKTAFDKGIVGWWNDETDKVSSGSTSYWFGNFTTGFTSQGLYQGQRSYSTNRVFQTARTFYPGAQRYGTSLWSGDIGIQFYKGEKSDLTWATGMQEQRSRMLSAINLGQERWGMDTGGFNPSTYNPNPELYARWIQFSSLTPVFRVHGNISQQRQPWYYGTTAEEAAKAAIQLRYSLIPYMYSYERSLNETGVGYVRPLVFDYPSDSNVANRTDEWQLGDWLLAAPVVDSNQTVKDVYLPAGTWVDYFRGLSYTGGQTVQYPVNTDTLTDIPMFIKKGAIIPTQKVQDYVGQSDITTAFVDVFPDTAQTSFTYYDDSGNDYNYENGTYFKQSMTTQDNGSNNYSFNLGAKTGSYTPSLQYYILKLHGKASTAVTINGTGITSYSDLNALKAYGGEGWATGKDIYGEVTYVKVAAAGTSSKNISATGSTSTGITSYKFEAEESSLSGNTTATKAGVNTNHNNYSGSGFVDGLGNNCAAATFYVNARVPGDYNVALRYANATGATKALSIFVNGTRVKQTSLANLGSSWDTWGTQTESLPLTSGNNIITYKYNSDAGDSGNVNLDYITVPFDPAIGYYQAETAQLSGGTAVARNHYFYSGPAFVDGFLSVGAKVNINDVYVPASGSYKVNLRYSNGSGSAKTLSTYVYGVKAGQISLPALADWNSWGTCEQTVNLNAGGNTIAFQYDTGDTGNVNLDRILVAATTPGTPESEKNVLDNPGFERPANFGSNWTEWHPSGQALAYGIDSGSGSNPPDSPWCGDKRAWFYFGSAYQQSIHQLSNVANGTYKIEAWVRYFGTDATTCRMEVGSYGGSTIYNNISKDGVWKYISSTASVTSGQVDVGFYVNSPGNTILLIDDVRLTKTP